MLDVVVLDVALDDEKVKDGEEDQRKRVGQRGC